MNAYSPPIEAERADERITAFAAWLTRASPTEEQMRVLAQACAKAARDLDGNTDKMVDAFDAAAEAVVRPWTERELKAQAVSYYSEMARDAAREAA